MKELTQKKPTKKKKYIVPLWPLYNVRRKLLGCHSTDVHPHVYKNTNKSHGIPNFMCGIHKR